MDDLRDEGFMPQPVRALLIRLQKPAIGTALALGSIAAPSLAAPRPNIAEVPLWATEGEVYSLACVGETLFAAGDVQRVGVAHANVASLDGTTGAVTSLMPPVDGQIQAAVGDGDGGWFIGGDFSAVGGQPHPHVAHVLANGRVANWDPGIDGSVSAMVRDGRRLYVGGGFTAVGHRTRNHIASIDTKSGQPDSWNPNADVWVRSLALGDGVIYVGGPFTSVGGESRHALAAIDLTSGRATSWNPDAEGSGDESYPTNVTCIVVAGNQVFVSGEFTSIGGLPRVHLAALDRAMGAPTTWHVDIRVRGHVTALAVRGRNLYVGGTLGFIGGKLRGGAAAVDIETGAVADWDPAENGDVSTLSIDGDRVYLGGVFFDSATDPPSFLEAVDLSTGRKLAWKPNPSNLVFYLAAQSNTVIVSGRFAMFGGLRRYGLAAIDLATGKATDWAPHPDNAVTMLRANGPTLYAAGNFVSISGETRVHLAAFDGHTGGLSLWQPPLSDAALVRDAVATDSTFCALVRRYVPGSVEDSILAFDPTSAARQSWPDVWSLPQWNLDGCVAMERGILYAPFSTMGANGTWSNFERIDSRSGTFGYFGPGLYGQTIDHLAIAGDLLFAVGHFEPPSVEDPWFLEAIDLATGKSVPWIVRANREIRAIATDGQTIYAGGSFSTIDSRDAQWLAAFDATTGVRLGWDPRVNGSVAALTLHGTDLFVGGSFSSLNGLPQARLGVVEGVRRAPPGRKATPPSSASPISAVAAARGEIRFTLAAATPVSIAVYDVSGRRVASVIEHQSLGVGEHAFPLGTSSLRAGLYLYRITTPGSTAGGKIVVLR